jgi:hypothetical protein
VNAYASAREGENTYITEIFDDEEDYDMEDTPDITDILCLEYKSIFNTTLRTKPARVPPLQFDHGVNSWQRPPNKLPARGLSVEKQLALSDLTNEQQTKDR